jgi:methionyl aminopeptidase
MIELKTQAEMDRMARGGSIIAALYQEIRDRIEPGVSTGALDRFAEEFIRSHDGAAPAFKGLYGFPGSICTSINSEVVHGIPSDARLLEEGDILSLDTGVTLDGWCSDSAWTFPVGEVAPQMADLLRVTRDALDRAIAAARPGNHIGDIGHAVEEAVHGTGFEIIRDLVGHGIGRNVHEDPQVPNRGKPGQGPQLRAGMTLAIEPMVSAGTWRIRTLSDRWTMATTDGAATAHFEHTVGVTEDAPRVLTGPGSAVPRPAG